MTLVSLSDAIESYTFAALAPGVVDVQIVNVLPWMDNDGIEDMFQLVVDEDLHIQRKEISLVQSFELREYGTMAAYRMLSAEPGDAGFLLVSSYVESYDGLRSDERSLLALPTEVTAAFVNAGVFAWDGYSGSKPDVLDGESFEFTASFEDGTTISASGTNSFPEGYSQFAQEIGNMLGLVRRVQPVRHQG